MTEELTLHEKRKLRNPNFNEEKARYKREYYERNKEKLRTYNRERARRLKQERIESEQSPV